MILAWAAVIDGASEWNGCGLFGLINTRVVSSVYRAGTNIAPSRPADLLNSLTRFCLSNHMYGLLMGVKGTNIIVSYKSLSRIWYEVIVSTRLSVWFDTTMYLQTLFDPYC